MNLPQMPTIAKPMLAVRAYKCKYCGKVVDRESNKQWIKSYCDEIGEDVRLMLIKAWPLTDANMKRGGNLAKLLMRGCKLKSLTVCSTGATARLFYICCYRLPFINRIINNLNINMSGVFLRLPITFRIYTMPAYAVALIRLVLCNCCCAMVLLNINNKKI